MSLTTQVPVRDNPYVGPRPFREADRLYGRDREARDVIVMLMAERILVVHSPSGAGKTSLLQAKVIPTLKNDDGFDVSDPLRVNAVPADGFQPRNRYSWSVIVGMVGGDAAARKEFADMTLVEFLNSEHDPFADSEYRVLVLDQFEEILTLDPGDRIRQAEFFQDLGTALKSQNCWALLSMREDFIGGLAPFASLVPSHLKVRYRIDFLDHDAALEAARKPAEDAGVDFQPKAANALVKDLAKVRRQLPGEQTATTIDGPYVEPVQLQAACTELWRRLRKERGEGFRKITPGDVRDFGDLDAALGAYYANAVMNVAQATDTSERAIRDWFEEKLITEDGEFRNQTQVGPAADAVEEVLRLLADQYLIRSDQRGATRWYELAHDRLIGPLCANNDAWRYEHLDSFEISARDWERSGRSEIYLLGPMRVEHAKKSLGEQLDNSSPLLHEFVAASEKWHRSEQRKRRREQLVSAFGLATVILGIVVVIETVLILILLG